MATWKGNKCRNKGTHEITVGWSCFITKAWIGTFLLKRSSKTSNPPPSFFGYLFLSKECRQFLRWFFCISKVANTNTLDWQNSNLHLPRLHPDFGVDPTYILKQQGACTYYHKEGWRDCHCIRKHAGDHLKHRQRMDKMINLVDEDGCTCILWLWPPLYNSHHQDCYISKQGIPINPHFPLLGAGHTQGIPAYRFLFSNPAPNFSTLVIGILIYKEYSMWSFCSVVVPFGYIPEL